MRSKKATVTAGMEDNIVFALRVESHQAHCCRRHGCKYGDNPCPVEHLGFDQEHPCENCLSMSDARHKLRMALSFFRIREALSDVFWARRVEKMQNAWRDDDLE